MIPTFSNINNNMSSSSAKSGSSTLLRLSQNPICWRCLVLFSFLAILYIAQQQQQLDMYMDVSYSTNHNNNNNNNGELHWTQDENEHHFFAATSPLRCIDADDNDKNPNNNNGKSTNMFHNNNTAVDTTTTNNNKNEVCRCGDPLVATPRRTTLWMQRHLQLQQMAQQALQDQQAGVEDAVEVVLLGDSIVEHFAGTRQMGTIPLPQEAKVFQEKLARSVNVLPLGCSGDTSTNLLYHLQHGMIPVQLKPRVFVVVIGTNDLSLGCSKRTALAGILQVIKTLHQQHVVVRKNNDNNENESGATTTTTRPKTKIIVHGLFPRQDHHQGDNENSADSSSWNHVNHDDNEYWNKIVWINKQLKTFCALHHPDWIYFDINNKLLQRHADNKARLEIKPGLFLEDGLHPSVEGYEIWAKKLKKLLLKVLTEGTDEQQSQQQEGIETEEEDED